MKVSVPAVAPPTPPLTGASSVSMAAATPRLMRALGAVDVDRRAVDDQRALACGRQEVRPARENMLAGRQHGDDHVGAADGAPGGGRDGRAGCGGGGLRRLDEIEAGNRMAGLDQVGDHRGAHVAEADEGDFGHVSSFGGAVSVEAQQL